MIGVQVFRKDESFDPHADRLSASRRRLRAKLVRYYPKRAGPIHADRSAQGGTPVIKRRDEPVAPSDRSAPRW